MSSSMRKLAKTVARLVRVQEGQTRAQQLRRSVIVSGESASTVADLLVGSVETAATTSEQAEDIARLDESDLIALDSLVELGDQTDMIGLEDAFTDQVQDASDQFDQAVELDEAVHAAHMTALAASEKVGTALAAANGAAIEAAAATETALGFARYSQIDGGEIFPTLPADGPRQGAELVLIDVNAHPYRVNVWNGTAWVKSQVLADQILVLGEDGTVQIENGRIVSPTIIGGNFYGNTFEGGLFTGGVIEQAGASVATGVYVEPFIGSVPAPGDTIQAILAVSIPLAQSTVMVRATRADQGAPTTSRGTWYVPSNYSGAQVTVSMLVRRSTAGAVRVGGRSQTIAANSWTRVVSNEFQANGADIIGVEADTTYVEFTEPIVTVVSSGTTVARLHVGVNGPALEFDSGGNARSRYRANGMVARDFRSDGSNGKTAITDRIIEMEVFNADGTHATSQAVGIRAPGNGLIIQGGDITTVDSKSQLQLYSEHSVRIRAPQQIWLDGPLFLQGDTGWTNIAIASGASGYAQWRRFMGLIHLRFNITTTTAVASDAAYTPAFTLPDAARADLSTSGLVSFAAVVGGSGGATGSMNTNGVVTLRNLHTTAQANFRGTAIWPPAG